MPGTGHVVVVGGTSGIGRCVAALFADRGRQVVITGRSHERAESAAEEIGGHTRGVGLDLTVPGQIAGRLADLPAVEHLVLAAIDRDHNTVRGYDLQRAAHLLTLKLVGYTAVVHALASRMGPDSSAVLLGGLAMYRPYPGSTTVTTVNGAVSALVRALAAELAPVRFNALHPSMVGDSPYWSDKPQALAAAKARVPTGRLVTMRDCADAVVFLLRNPSVNAVNLSIDGGEVMV